MRISTVLVAAMMLGWCNPLLAENPKPNPDLFRLVEGTWGSKENPDTSCEKRPHTIMLTDGNEKMILKYPDSGKQYIYRVLYAEKNQLTMLIEGEERRTDNGDRVIWVLILDDPNTYKWRRTDWKADGSTKMVVRCRAQ